MDVPSLLRPTFYEPHFPSPLQRMDKAYSNRDVWDVLRRSEDAPILSRIREYVLYLSAVAWWFRPMHLMKRARLSSECTSN